MDSLWLTSQTVMVLQHTFTDKSNVNTTIQHPNKHTQLELGILLSSKVVGRITKPRLAGVTLAPPELETESYAVVVTGTKVLKETVNM